MPTASPYSHPPFFRRFTIGSVQYPCSHCTSDRGSDVSSSSLRPPPLPPPQAPPCQDRGRGMHPFGTEPCGLSSSGQNRPHVQRGKAPCAQPSRQHERPARLGQAPQGVPRRQAYRWTHAGLVFKRCEPARRARAIVDACRDDPARAEFMARLDNAASCLPARRRAAGAPGEHPRRNAASRAGRPAKDARRAASNGRRGGGVLRPTVLQDGAGNARPAAACGRLRPPAEMRRPP